MKKKKKMKKYFFPPQSFLLTTTEKQLFKTQDPEATSSRKMHYNDLDWKKKADGRLFQPGVQDVNNSKGSVNLILKTKDEDSMSNGATVLAKMTSNLPSHHVNVSGQTKLQDLNLANPNFNEPSTDLIIGAGYYEQLTFGENRIKEPQKPNTYHLSCLVGS